MSDPVARAAAYRGYVLGMLTLVNTLNYLDTCLMILLLQPIKQDLHLTDSQLGFVTGIAFGVFYATLGVPIARLADRGNRVTITSVAIAVWALTVMACSRVSNFPQLVLARVAAGIGESGCLPPTYSLLGDYYPEPAQRTRAMGIYMLAGPIASLFSFIWGGWANEHYGWRITFFLVGIPGLLMSVLIKLTVAEPRIKIASETLRPPMTAVLGILWRQRTSRHLGISIVLLYIMGNGLGPWYAAFLMRSHAMTTGELGVWLGLIFGLGGMAGVLLGSYVMQRWFADDERGQMRLSALTIATLVPFFVLFLLLPGKLAALIALIPVITVSAFFIGPTFALMQRLVSSEMRATTFAVVMLLANLIGMGLGPQLVGLLSDWLVPFRGADSLRYAMLTMSLVSLWAAWHFWRAARSVTDDLLVVAATV